MDGPAKSLARALEPWLETIEGDAPFLLIAPHGGRAGEASRAVLHPKVNDLHTAAITRELAARIGAPALINAGMDRNSLDLNRISQVTANASWFLEAILERIAAIVARHGHCAVALVHGWNVIQPRIDLGVGLRRHGDELRPPGAARISASDEFIHGSLGLLAELLRGHGILTSFGLRYPGGGAQNLLQAFTDRHLHHSSAALRELSAIAARGETDAVQLELSVALRMPGAARERCLAALATVFAALMAPAHEAKSSARNARLSVVRTPGAPRLSAPAKSADSSAPPSRVGIELFDPALRIGAMASFDLGTGFGARIMVLLPDGGVALFTGEGRPTREGNRVRLGPLALQWDRGEMALSFRGPAVVVPDATQYLSIERALASGWLDESMEVAIRLRPFNHDANLDLNQLLADGGGAPAAGSPATFGTLSGSISVGGVAAAISGFGRSGLSFTGIGPQRFSSRKMIWACLEGAPAGAALELRAISAGNGEHRSGRMLTAGGWIQCTVARIEVETPSMTAAPVRVAAEFTGPDANGGGHLIGHVENFIPLSRPGPDNSRLYTALGFATFTLDGFEGAGMFECSRRTDEPGGDDDADD